MTSLMYRFSVGGAFGLFDGLAATGSPTDLCEPWLCRRLTDTLCTDALLVDACDEDASTTSGKRSSSFSLLPSRGRPSSELLSFRSDGMHDHS